MKKYSTISIPKEIFDKFKKFCNENGYSISKYLVILIEKNINIDGEKNESNNKM